MYLTQNGYATTILRLQHLQHVGCVMLPVRSHVVLDTWQPSRVTREAEAKAEQRAMQTHLKGLPEGEEGEDEPSRPSLLPAADAADADQGPQDLNTVLRRMKEVARVLESFQQLREEGRSRAEYMDQVFPARSIWKLISSVIRLVIYRQIRLWKGHDQEALALGCQSPGKSTELRFKGGTVSCS